MDTRPPSPEVKAAPDESAPRFAFGRNWRDFVGTVDAARVASAIAALRRLLGRERLDGLRFLDIGCGSGLSSLAARELGARVHGFDFDPDSVAATAALKARARPDDPDWTFEVGSALDPAYLDKLGTFDIVYSWGVLHHTGEMWRALDLAAGPVAPGGLLAVAIYNDQGNESKRWAAAKRAYLTGPKPVRAALIAYCVYRQWGKQFLHDLLFHGDPTRTWRGYGAERGMSAWHDVIDWIGGWPFEVATPEAIFERFKGHGFALERLKTCGGGIGCNEFLFRRTGGR